MVRYCVVCCDLMWCGGGGGGGGGGVLGVTPLCPVSPNSVLYRFSLVITSAPSCADLSHPVLLPSHLTLSVLIPGTLHPVISHATLFCVTPPCPVFSYSVLVHPNLSPKALKPSGLSHINLCSLSVHACLCCRHMHMFVTVCNRAIFLQERVALRLAKKDSKRKKKSAKSDTDKVRKCCMTQTIIVPERKEKKGKAFFGSRSC